MTHSDKLSDARIDHYATLPTQPNDAVFMYEVRRMAQELKSLRATHPRKINFSYMSGGNWLLPEEYAALVKEDVAELYNLTHGLKAAQVGDTIHVEPTNGGCILYFNSSDGDKTAIVSPEHLANASPLFKALVAREGIPDIELSATGGTKLAAARWNALLSTPALRLLGEANVTRHDVNADYCHFGAELWTVHGGYGRGTEGNEHMQKVLTAFADRMIRNNEMAKSMNASFYNPGGDIPPISYELRGEGFSIDIDNLEGDAIFAEIEPATRLAMIRSSARKRGICRDVTLVFNRDNSAFVPFHTQGDKNTFEKEFLDYWNFAVCASKEPERIKNVSIKNIVPAEGVAGALVVSFTTRAEGETVPHTLTMRSRHLFTYFSETVVDTLIKIGLVDKSDRFK